MSIVLWAIALMAGILVVSSILAIVTRYGREGGIASIAVAATGYGVWAAIFWEWLAWWALLAALAGCALAWMSVDKLTERVLGK
ncbi:hypothetical protein [Acrocarpospora phusangensis]|uniref:hypothetical protein n=1 Tax=Acrocarpospora phusangensis TaxID=1070424 RepID=UPI00194DE6F9|nr:hypothetical protein [Acrocarpospora phusangensis]